MHHLHHAHHSRSARRHGSLPRQPIIVALVLGAVAATLLLADCGNPSIQGSPTQTTTRTTKPAGAGVPRAPSQHLRYDHDGIYAETQMTCGQFDVLASTRLTYDASEIRAIHSYVDNTFNNGLNPKRPPSLVWATGGVSCAADIQFANKGSSAFVVQHVSVKLLTSPLRNTYSYRLIDICSIIPQSNACFFSHGGGPECDHYSASIHLASGSTGATYSGAPQPADTTCPDRLTVSPGPNAMFLHVDFSADNLKYVVALQLQVQTSSGPKTITLSQPSSTLIFARAGQFSCYALHGSHFTLEYKGTDALRMTDTSDVRGHLCV